MFELLKRLFFGATARQSRKLGSEADLIRQLLFASQSLCEQARLVSSGGFAQTVADAQRLAEQGNTTGAAALLRNILDLPDVETRTQLWVWAALCELGERPEGKSAFEVLGAVLEMPSGGAYDTLAAYVDGSARYLNFSGRAIFWDAGDPKIKRLCQALVDSTIPASTSAKPRMSLLLPRRGIQVTMLTRSGPFVISSPPKAVVDAGAALMLELIQRSENLPTGPAEENIG